MEITKRKRLLAGVLLSAFLGFTLLSWWLLFRDERALLGITFFYPQLDTQLLEIRTLLLKYGLNVLPTLAFGTISVIAFGSYVLSLKTPFSLKQSVILALIFQAISFFAYPILSTDIFSYIFSDRVLTEYHQNVWTVPPNTFSHDPFERLADWKDQTKVYGGVNQLIYWPAAIIGNDNLFKTVVAYKLVPAFFALITLFVVLRSTREQGEKAQSQLVRLLFWNPLFVLEILGAGHNDIAMLCFFLLSLFFWQRKKWVRSGFALALAVQIKLIPVVFLGFAVFYLLQKRQWSALLKMSGAFLSVNVVVFYLMKVSPLVFLERVLYNTSVYWQSLPAVINRFIGGEKLFFSAALLTTVVALMIWQFRKKQEPMLTTAIALLCYLLFFSAAYWNWYVLWLFVFIPFIKNSNLKNTILVFSFTSLMAYPLLWLALRLNHQDPMWPFAYYAWIFGVPISYWWLTVKKRVPLFIS